ncbi:unnamed protein product [Diamesa serratosioi]
MKCNKIVLLVAVSIVVEAVVGQMMYEKGVRIQTLTFQTPADICTVGNRLETICNNPRNPCDSNGLVFCTGTGSGLALACPTATPNCITTDIGDVCSTSRDTNCPAPVVAQFQCTSVGYFPDPNNCQVFHYCSVNKVNMLVDAETFTCREGYVFDPTAPQAGYCTLKASAKCNTINCTGFTNETYVQYGNSRQIYALCLSNASPLMFSCPDGNVANLSAFPVQCNYQCELPGRFPYSLKNSMFYNCFWNSQFRLQAELKSCPRGNQFNPRTKHCAVVVTVDREMSINLVTFVIAVVLVSGQKKVFSYQNYEAKAPSEICTGANRYQTICNNENPCASNGIIFCTQSGNGIPILCGGNQPNCVTNERGGTCSATRDERCATLPAKFTCTSVGRFPDPDDCRLFYNCDWNDEETDIVAEVMSCRTGEVFDLNNINRDCRTQLNPADCPLIRCINSISIYIRYSINSNYFGLCVPNSKTIMFNCPESNILDLTVQPPKCTFVCPNANGRFAYSLDVFKYYECYQNFLTKKTESELRLCPRRQEFNPRTSRCESSLRPSSTTTTTTIKPLTSSIPAVDSSSSKPSTSTLIVPTASVVVPTAPGPVAPE